MSVKEGSGLTNAERFTRLRACIGKSPLRERWLADEVDEVLAALSEDFAAEENAEAAGAVHDVRQRVKEAFEHVLHGKVTR